MDAHCGRRRLGSLSRRALALDRAVGLDLGGRSALGIRSLPLWALGVLWRPLGLDTRTLWRNPPVRAGAGGVGRWRKRWWFRFQPEFLHWHVPGGRLVPAGPARTVFSVL